MRFRTLVFLLLVYVIRGNFLYDTKGVDTAIDYASRGHVVYYIDPIVGVYKFWRHKKEIKFEKVEKLEKEN